MLDVPGWKGYPCYSAKMTLFFTLWCLFSTAVINTPTCCSDGSAVVLLEFENLEHKSGQNFPKLPGQKSVKNYRAWMREAGDIEPFWLIWTWDTSKHELLWAFKCINSFFNPSLLPSHLFFAFAALMTDAEFVIILCYLCCCVYCNNNYYSTCSLTVRLKYKYEDVTFVGFSEVL